MMGDGLQVQQAFKAAEKARLKGRWREAVAAYRRALMLAPGDRTVANNLAWVLATCPEDAVRSGRQAVGLMRWAGSGQGDLPWQYVGTLAAAHAECGEFEQAMVLGKRAQELAAGTDEGRWGRWLREFAQGRALREGA